MSMMGAVLYLRCVELASGLARRGLTKVRPVGGLDSVGLSTQSGVAAAL